MLALVNDKCFENTSLLVHSYWVIETHRHPPDFRIAENPYSLPNT